MLIWVKKIYCKIRRISASNTKNYSVWSRHLTGGKCLVQVLAPLLPLQLPANAHWEKEAGDGLRTWVLVTYMGGQIEFLASVGPSPDCCRHFGSETADARSLSVSLSLVFIKMKSISRLDYRTVLLVNKVGIEFTNIHLCMWICLNGSSGSANIGCFLSRIGWLEYVSGKEYPQHISAFKY